MSWLELAQHNFDLSDRWPQLLVQVRLLEHEGYLELKAAEEKRVRELIFKRKQIKKQQSNPKLHISQTAMVMSPAGTVMKIYKQKHSWIRSRRLKMQEIAGEVAHNAVAMDIDNPDADADAVAPGAIDYPDDDDGDADIVENLPIVDHIP